MRKALVAILLLAVLAAAYFTLKFRIEAEARQRIDAFLRQRADIVSVGYGDLDARLLPPGLLLRDVVAGPAQGPARSLPGLGAPPAPLPPDPVSVDRLLVAGRGGFIEAFRGLRDMSSAHLRAQGVSLPPSLLGLDRATAEALGFGERIKADVGIDYAWSPDEKTLALDTVRLTLPGSGETHASLHLTRFEPPRTFLAAILTLPAARLQGGELLYEDESLAGRVLNWLAKREGLEPERFREALIAELARREQALVGRADAAEARQVLSALAEFARRPVSLRLTAAPPQPVSLGELLQTGDLVKLAGRLRLSARANEAGR